MADKPHLRLHYHWSKGLERYVWFVMLPPDKYGYKFPTSWKDTSAEAIKSAGEYYR